MRVEDIDLDYVISIIPSFLGYKFRRMNVRTLGDVLNIDLEAFSRLKNIGAKAVQMLCYAQLDILHNPSKYISAYAQAIEYIEECARKGEAVRLISIARTKETIIPTQIGSCDTLIESVRKFDAEYYALIEKHAGRRFRNYDILRKTIGIGGEQHSLKELGVFYGITKERARKIKETELALLNKLFNGEALKFPPLRCSGDFVSRIESFRMQLNNRTIISQTHAYKLTDGDSSKGTERNDERCLDLLLRVFGYQKAVYKGNKLYFRSDTYSLLSLKQSLKAVYNVLKTSFYPLEETEILDKMKKREGKSATRNVEIIDILSEAQEYEEIVIEGKICYQLPFNRLFPADVKAARVLFEADRPLHFRDIAQAINKKLAKYGSKRVSLGCLRGAMVSSEHVEALGKQGKWSLVKWGFCRLTVRAQMEQALRAAGVPMTTEQLLEAIRGEHHPVRRSTLISFVWQYKDVFARLNTGEIVLREWRMKKEKVKKSKRITKYNDALMMRTIAEIFREKNQRALYKTVLRELLAKKGYAVSSSTFYTKILRYPIFCINPKEIRHVALREDYERIIESVQSNPKRLKRDIMHEFISRLLKKNDNKMVQINLVSAVETEFNCHCSSIYIMLQNKALFLREKIGSTVYVSALAPAANDPDLKR